MRVTHQAPIGPILDTDGPQTWFEAEANHDQHTRQLIICNDPTHPIPHVHRVQWDCSRLDGSASVSPSLREWLGTLAPGGTLSMVPVVAANSERRNWVGYVTVEVYCACV